MCGSLNISIIGTRWHFVPMVHSPSSRGQHMVLWLGEVVICGSSDISITVIRRHFIHLGQDDTHMA